MTIDTAELSRWLDVCESANLLKVPVPIKVLRAIIERLKNDHAGNRITYLAADETGDGRAN